MATMSLTVEVDESLYPGLLSTVCAYVNETKTSDGRLKPDGDRIMESGLNKRLWGGYDAEADAITTLLSMTGSAWRLIEVFTEDPRIEFLTIEELAEKANMTTQRVMAYRQLMGKQAWRAGERANPISSKRINEQMRYYLRPEALTAFSRALDKISDSQS